MTLKEIEKFKKEYREFFGSELFFLDYIKKNKPIMYKKIRGLKYDTSTIKLA